MLLITGLSACDDFLEEKAKDKIIPKTIREYDELFYGEAYVRGDVLLGDYLDIMTDDVKLQVKTGFAFGVDIRENTYGYFTWQADPEMALSGARNSDKAWKWLYHSILMANITLRDLAEATGSIQEREQLEAEVYFIRAWDYYMLVNLYGKPYVKETADIELGVPISKVEGMEDVLIGRSSVAEVYEQIQDDLDKAIELFSGLKYTNDYFKGNIAAAYLLASRISLYKKEYDDVITYTEKAFMYEKSLYDLNAWEYGDKVISAKSPEIIFTYGDAWERYYSSSSFIRAKHPASAELLSEFDTNDLRKSKYIKSWGSVPIKRADADETKVFGYAFRTSELYLNRAEAYAETGELDKAIKDIETIRKFRYVTGSDYSLSLSGDDSEQKKQAIAAVRSERRKELCFEQHRWFDLRRWGMPEIKHTFIKGTKDQVEEVYVLEENDPAYTLPIPYDLVSFDKEIEQIKRPDRLPVVNP